MKRVMLRGIAKRVGSKLMSGAVRAREAVLSQRFGFSPSIIYGPNFYRDHVDQQQGPSAPDLVGILVDLFHPASVFDVGCGNGLYLREFARRGVFAAGCDGSRHAVGAVPEGAFVFLHDLRHPLAVNRRFDLTTCFEVAEHLPARFAAPLVEACVRTSNGVVVFSSAKPGQGGTDHINEQPDDYWDALFVRHGFRPAAGETASLRERAQARAVVHWLTANTRVYRG